MIDVFFSFHAPKFKITCKIKIPRLTYAYVLTILTHTYIYYLMGPVQVSGVVLCKV